MVVSKLVTEDGLLTHGRHGIMGCYMINAHVNCDVSGINMKKLYTS